MVARRILVLNAGSSSLKGSLIEAPEETLARAEQGWGADASRAADPSMRVAALVERLQEQVGGGAIDAVAHRVVHGGSRFRAPTIVDPGVLEGIRSVRALAPLHNGVALEAMEAALEALPDASHVACFDTAFHASLPEAAWRYPLPLAWHDAYGIRRYGFHGLSVAWAVSRAARLLDHDPAALSVVVAHLGSGCSVTAVDGGRSVDTSMGWTPLEGLMMGTRAGSIDPGIVVRLVADGRVSLTEMADTLDHGAGLLAVAGTADMRAIVEAADAGDARAGLALAMFVRRAAAAIAAAATALPELHAIAFTGGIGERSHAVRAAIIERLGVLGATGPLTPDPGPGDALLAPAGAPVAVLRVIAREDLVMAREAEALLDGRAAPNGP